MSNYKVGQKVELLILRETPLGFVAQINGVDEGLLYHNEIFEHLEPDMTLPGYVRLIRDNGTIDLILQPLGYSGVADLGEQILKTLKDHKGFLPVTSKTEAEEIYNLFGVSKKKFKMAIGGLYKKRLIKITDEGIHLSETNQT